jgi:ABC-type lipoprotein export system ATPase subunit/GNAT superfamily N-acetyltransferase
MILESNVEQDEITKKVSQMFDHPFDGKIIFEVPSLPSVPKEFGVGLIVGPSGSGKSSLLKQFGTQTKHTWEHNKSVASHFNSFEDANERLTATGFNSIPSWLRPYHVLSNGEQFRADLARSLESGSVIDEFTSVIDRNVAMSCSNAMRRYVDKKGLKNIVMASCHYDIIEWLRPDWIYDTSTQVLDVRGSRRRPKIELQILPCSTDAWTIFKHHHYLDGNISKAAKCWIAIWNDVPVAFHAALPLPQARHGKLPAWRGHRTVVLPDFQGLGIGIALTNELASMFFASDIAFYSKTAHPTLGNYRNSVPHLWRPTPYNMKNSNRYKGLMDGNNMYSDEFLKKHAERICYAHEYIGPKSSVRALVEKEEKKITKTKILFEE